MAHIIADRVRDTSTSTGTGAFTVSGTPDSGYRTFSAVLATSDTCYYAIQHKSADEWEVGVGTYSSANTITRTTVLSSSNAGSAVSFSAGTKDIFITVPADKVIQEGLNNELVLNTGAQTANNPALNITQTWNNAAVTFTGYKLNVTDTASNASSLLMDLQVGGSSKFSVNKSGAIAFFTASAASISFSNWWSASQSATGGIAFGSGHLIAWNSAGNVNQIGGVSGDTYLSRRGIANLRFGAADAASPIAQTLSVQSVVAGTTNTPGADFKITGSQGTGTGAGGSIIFQTAPANSGGGAGVQNTLVNAIAFEPTGVVRLYAGGSAQHGINGLSGFSIIPAGGAGATALWSLQNGETLQRSDATINWSSTSNPSGTRDLILARDTTNTLAQRNGVNAQTFRLYNTYTDASNYERAVLGWSSNILQIGTEKAGTGSSRNTGFYYGGNLVAGVIPDGLSTGRLRLGGTILGTQNVILDPSANGRLVLWNSGASGFDLLQFGGTTSSFPALKRSTTTLQARLADDSAFAPIQGQLTTDTAYVATPQISTGYITIYDSTGTAYKVLVAT